MSIHVLDRPEWLRIFLGAQSDRMLTSAVRDADEVKAGQFLALWNDAPCMPSPVDGRVEMDFSTPDIRAGRAGRAIKLQPRSQAAAVAFEPLDPDSSRIEEIRERIRMAGVFPPTLYPAWDGRIDGSRSLVISALDQEPGVCVSASLMEERKADIGRALRLLGRCCDPQSVFFVVPDNRKTDAYKIDLGAPIRLVAVPPVYPQALPISLMHRIGDPNALILSIESALAILDCIEQGQVPSLKTLSLIRSGQEPSDVVRVHLGTSLSEIARQCGLHLDPADKVVAGGPMRGYAQYSLEAVVDAGIDAITVVRADELVSFGNDPCIHCGACIDVCPLRLQAQSIGRYSEFGKFEATRQYGIEHCIECGLCASVCTARRPLLQLIRLAKQQLAQTDRDADERRERTR